MKRRSVLILLILTALCCLIMALVDGVLRPGYVFKSAIKAVLFLGVPLVLSFFDRNIQLLSLFRPNRKGVLPAIALGIGIYVLILGAYLLLSPYFDFSGIADSLTQNSGVSRSNFLMVSLYISFANSFLEEFFFRGFVFTNMKKLSGRVPAYLVSAGAFSLYHIPMMLGWFSPLLFLLVMLGLAAGGVIFSWLNEKMDTIYCSWLTHMFANFAINTIGFILLQ